VKNEYGFAAKPRRGPEVAMLEQAIRRAGLPIRRMFSWVRLNVDPF
jgi:hypothetical protein